jgi:hypothetical protein
VRLTPALCQPLAEWDNHRIMRQEPVLPTGRAAVFTAVCVGLAVVAHTWMSGAQVPLWALPAGLVPVFATARLAAGRERSLGSILALMTVDQTALHLLFDAAQQHAAAVASAVGTMTVSPAAIIVQLPPAPLPGMDSIPAVPAAALSMPGMDGMNMPGMGASSPAAPMHMTVGMFAAHAIAALICSWWLRRGEATVHELFAAVAAWVADRFRLPPLGRPAPITAGPATTRPRGTSPRRPAAGFLRFAVARRGPPAPEVCLLRLTTP